MRRPADTQSQDAGSDRAKRTGLVTLLFTDMVGSTELKHELGDRAAAELFRQHHELIRQTLKHFPEGEEIETAGDSFLITFATPSDAVEFALLAQARLRRLQDAGGSSERIGIHVGEVVVGHDTQSRKPRDLFGIQIDTCSRVMSLAKAGQTLMTRAAFDSARQVLKGEDLEGIGPLEWLNHGPYLLKGLDEPVEVCEVREAGQEMAPGPPTSSEKAQRQVRADEEPVLGWRPAVGQVVPNTRWVLEKKLGEGGFGEVWLGRHQTMKEQRVFKFCFRADRVRSLKREMTLFRLIKERIGDHPNIVALREVYFEQPPYYLEEDYVAGQDLKTWSEERGSVASVPLEQKLEIVAQVAEALQAAHDAGVIHRDVKPANILIGNPKSEIRNPKLEVKLTDFGIGQVVSQEYLAGVTKAGFTMTLLGSGSSSQTGTQMYMAPELLAGKPASIRSDIYSLGVVLYQLLVGDLTRPLTTDWAREIADPLLQEDLRHCFAGNPQERFAGAGQLTKHLRALPERRAELARQQADLAAREKAAYRRGIVRTTMAAALVVAVIGLLAIYALAESHRARSEARRADLNAQNAVKQRDLAQGSVYDADMFRAFEVLDAGNLGHARELMRKHLPQSGETDLRGWEWRRLWQQCRGNEMFTLDAQPDAWPTVAAFFPDGRTVAAASTDKTVRLFDLESRQLSATLPHSDSVYALAVSADGKLLASGCDDGTIRLWDAAARQVTIQLTNAHTVSALLFSGDGRVLAWADHERVVVWDLVARRERASYARFFGYGWFRTSIAFSPDGRLFVFGRWDGKIEVWDWQNQSRTALLPGHQVPVQTLAFSPDGRRLASGDNDHITKVWEPSTGRELATLTNHSGWVGSLSFSPDGKTLATAGADQTVKLWSTESWAEITTLRGHEDEVWWVAFAPDGHRLITASRDGSLKVWDARAMGERKVAHLPLDWPFYFAPDGQSLLRVHTNSTFSVTDISTFRETERRPWPITGEWTSAVLSNDKRFIVVGFPDGPCKLLDTTTGHDLSTFSEKSAPARRLYFSSDGATLAVIKGEQNIRDQFIEIWDMGTRRQIRKVDAHPSQIRAASFSPDSRRLTAGYYDGTLEEWDLTTGRKRTLVDPRMVGVIGVAYSPDGRTLATVGWDYYIRLWGADTGKVLARMRGGFSGFPSVTFSGDGRRLAVGGQDGKVTLWDLGGSRPQEAASLKGRGGDNPVRYVWFTPGRDTLVALTSEGVHVWRAPPMAEIDAAEKGRGQSPPGPGRAP